MVKHAHLRSNVNSKALLCPKWKKALSSNSELLFFLLLLLFTFIFLLLHFDNFLLLLYKKTCLVLMLCLSCSTITAHPITAIRRQGKDNNDNCRDNSSYRVNSIATKKMVQSRHTNYQMEKKATKLSNTQNSTIWKKYYNSCCVEYKWNVQKKKWKNKH